MKTRCLNCGKEFKASTEKQKYCSGSCRTMACNKRKSEQSITEIEPESDSVNGCLTLNFTEEEMQKITERAEYCGMSVDEYVKLKIMVDEKIAINHRNELTETTNNMQKQIDKLTLKLKEERVKMASFETMESEAGLYIPLTIKQRKILESLVKQTISDEEKEMTLADAILLHVFYDNLADYYYNIEPEVFEQLKKVFDTNNIAPKELPIHSYFDCEEEGFVQAFPKHSKYLRNLMGIYLPE
jgi:hypothetical protein